MSLEQEQSEGLSNEQLRKQLEEKYNINLDIQKKDGEKTYWDLREYFTREIEMDNILISSDFVTICCHRTDIEGIKEEFNKKLKELTENENDDICEAPCMTSDHQCQYGDNTTSNLENTDISQEAPPPYN